MVDGLVEKKLKRNGLELNAKKCTTAVRYFLSTRARIIDRKTIMTQNKFHTGAIYLICKAGFDEKKRTKKALSFWSFILTSFHYEQQWQSLLLLNTFWDNCWRKILTEEIRSVWTKNKYPKMTAKYWYFAFPAYHDSNARNNLLDFSRVIGKKSVDSFGEREEVFDFWENPSQNLQFAFLCLPGLWCREVNHQSCSTKTLYKLQTSNRNFDGRHLPGSFE